MDYLGLVSLFLQFCDSHGVAFAAFFALALAAPLCASAAVGLKINEDCATAEFSFDAGETARELVLGYGLSDAGAAAAAWDNSVKVADVPAGATSLSGIALPAGCGTSWKVARAFLPREATARDYIQRGLVLQYDGRENAGYGLHEDAVRMEGPDRHRLLDEEARRERHEDRPRRLTASKGGIDFPDIEPLWRGRA